LNQLNIVMDGWVKAGPDLEKREAVKRVRPPFPSAAHTKARQGFVDQMERSSIRVLSEFYPSAIQVLSEFYPSSIQVLSILSKTTQMASCGPEQINAGGAHCLFMWSLGSCCVTYLIQLARHLCGGRALEGLWRCHLSH
jgi:hypothetical protein